MAAQGAPVAQRPARLGVNMRSREEISGWLWASPWIIGFFVFTLGPMLASLYLSFTEYDVITDPRFVGLANYQKALTQDDLFWPSLGRTFQFSLIVVPLGLTGSLLLAILLNRGRKGTNFFRTIFFLPHLTPDAPIRKPVLRVPAAAPVVVTRWLREVVLILVTCERDKPARDHVAIPAALG